MKNIVLKTIIWLSVFSGMVYSESQTIREIATLIKTGHITEARHLLSETEDQLPEDHIVFLHGLLSTDGNLAIGYYEDLLKKYPQSQYGDDALFRLAQLKYAQGLYKTAQQRFQGVLNNFPDSPLHQQAQYWIGICFQAMELPDSAATRLEKAVEDYPYSSFTQIVRHDLVHFHDLGESKETPFIKSAVQYYIQVGAFTHQPNALLRKSFFENKGHPVVLRSKIKDGQELYLVWIGSFETLEKARAAGEQLKKKYGIRYTPVSE